MSRHAALQPTLTPFTPLTPAPPFPQASGCEFYARVTAVMGEAQAQGGRPVRPLQFLGPARLQLIIAAMQIERHANTKSSKLQAFASRALALVARDSEAGATAVLDADAVEPLVNALALYMDLPQLRAEVLNAFSALTCSAFHASSSSIVSLCFLPEIGARGAAATAASFANHALCESISIPP